MIYISPITKLTIVGQPKKRRPGFLLVQEVLTIVGLPHVLTTIFDLFLFLGRSMFYMVMLCTTVGYLWTTTFNELGTKHAKKKKNVLQFYGKVLGTKRATKGKWVKRRKNQALPHQITSKDNAR